jgi:poly(A) polymerase
VYERFGTAKLTLRQSHLPDVDIEVVMPRVETYTPGSRNPDVVYTTLTEDAKRRDFTVNALFENISTGEILDLVDGRADLQLGFLRTAIDPALIFIDDPLRMLRAVRFQTRFNWELDKLLVAAAEGAAWRIETISAERIRDELVKMLEGPRPAQAIRLLEELNLLSFILPEIQTLKGVTQNAYHVDDVFDHTLKVLRATPPDLVTRLTALFHDVGKPITRSIGEDGRVHFYDHEEKGVEITRTALERLKFPNAVVDTVSALVGAHMRFKQAGPEGAIVSDRALRKARAEFGAHLPRLLDVMHADNLAHSEEHALPHQIPGVRARLAALQDEAPKPTLPINGRDVMELLGIGPGPEVGRYLKVVEEAWYADPTITREVAVALIEGLR